MNERIAIFDLDGTLADNSHRQHFVQVERGKRNWKAFTAACDEDAPMEKVIGIARLLKMAFYRVIIFSGRSDEVKIKTLNWLAGNKVPYDEIHMRKAGDHRDDREVKREMLETVIGPDNYDKVDFIFDDRNRVVDLWREMGFQCFQVAPGDF